MNHVPEKYLKPRKPKCFYKVRDTVSGLFSTGGEAPGWGSTGKTWASSGDLQRHMKSLKEPYPETAEVAYYEVREIAHHPVSDWRRLYEAMRKSG